MNNHGSSFLTLRFATPQIGRGSTHGGLIAYAADPVDQYRCAAGYIDGILKGEKPADLPVRRRSGCCSLPVAGARPPAES
jgi:hypothetical protein